MQPLVENTNIPAFLGKLWKMVDDPATDHLISWSQAGNSFIIQNQAQFWYELLPLYYKHNNMSSFVRQLNMYGFHKITTVENGSMDADKDEIQFYHPYFQKDQPEFLINIKRKCTSSKGHESQGIMRNDDLTKVLGDVKQLRGRQSSVDSQLAAMKQENAVLWRELALLRQKHMKQQQIVNKLIQFLVTLVQPTASNRMGVGVKRRMPLMLHESSSKRVKTKKNNRPTSIAGPTIFELDNELSLSPSELLEEGVEEEVPLITSPVASTASVSSELSSKNVNLPVTEENVQNEIINQESINANPIFWDKPEFVDIEDGPDPEENVIGTLFNNTEPAEKIFINPSNRNTLIGNLLSSGSYNANVLGDKTAKSGKNATVGKKQLNDKPINMPPQSTMQVATKNNKAKTSSTNPRPEGFREELDLHLDHAQNELDQLKDILNGCNTFDANALLGLFTENDPEYGIRGTLQNKDASGQLVDPVDPLVSGNELAPASNLIDFNELFDDDSLNNQENLAADSDLISPAVDTSQIASLDTPLIVKNEPIFTNST